MVTNLVVFENGELKREPTEVTYRTVTYYFDDTVAKIVDQPKPTMAPAVPEAGEVREQEVLNVGALPATTSQVGIEGEPPPLLKSVVKSAESEVKPATDKTDQKTANDLLVQGHEFLKAEK